MAKTRYQSFKDASEGRFGASRLDSLRKLLAERGLDGFLIPRADEHQNEYLPASEERLAWLTGFTGSAGFAIVLKDRAAVFSDGRYTEQLAAQIDLTVFEARSVVDHPPAQWLATHAKPGSRIGYDPRRHTSEGLGRFEAVARKADLGLFASEPNPLDVLWEDRPAPPLAQVSLYPHKYAGVKSTDKVLALQQWLVAEKLDALMISDPTDLAWLFNIRGGDVLHKPLPIGYGLVPATGQPQLFMDGRKFSNAIRDKLADSIDITEPDAVLRTLTALGSAKARVRFDKDSASTALVDQLAASGGTADLGTNPIALRKAVKNKAECEGARQAQIRDGAAMVNFLHWFDTEATQGALTEIDVAVALEGFRHDTGMLKDISFDTISAAGPNAALPHYRVNQTSNRKIGKGIFLIDSGGQYLDGTTDITRTIAVGKPTAEMMDRNTRVLKGMIAISTLCFPQGTSGAQIDSFSRQFLWQAGLEFDHGTGHGVGSYLGVHEGPQRIAKTGTTPLQAGMILSNEPGYYKPGHFGIRIENLVLVEERAIAGGERSMLGFETLTLCPIDRRLIKIALLTEAERQWLNAYHARVLKIIGPLVSGPVRQWLKTACARL
jgi:Xaa-Pro aminopeptidase